MSLIYEKDRSKSGLNMPKRYRIVVTRFVFAVMGFCITAIIMLNGSASMAEGKSGQEL